MSLTIRPISPSDIPSLLGLYRHLIPEDPPLARDDAAEILKRISAYAGSAIYGGFENGALVTSCALFVVPNLTRGGRSFALIENVVTHAAHRNRGHGKAILKAVVNAALEHDCYKVMLLTGSKRPETIIFYLGAGFEQTKTGFEIRILPRR